MASSRRAAIVAAFACRHAGFGRPCRGLPDDGRGSSPGRDALWERYLMAAVPGVRRRERASAAAHLDKIRHRRGDQGPAIHAEPVFVRAGWLGQDQWQAGPGVHDGRVPDVRAARHLPLPRTMVRRYPARTVVQRGLLRGPLCRDEPWQRWVQAPRGVDRRRTPARPALAKQHRAPTARKPLRGRGPDEGAARRRLRVRTVLLRLGVARHHRGVAASRRAGLGHCGHTRLPQRGP